MASATSQTEVKETLSLQQQVQDWADLHYQNYILDLTEGPDPEIGGFVRNHEVVPLNQVQLALEESRCPKNWKTAWPKKFGWALPRGMKPPSFLTWQDAISFWKHHVREHDRMKRHQNAVKKLKRQVKGTDNWDLWRQRPDLYRFQPTRFKLPKSEIADRWVERVNSYFLKRMVKRKVLNHQKVIEISCYSCLEEEDNYLKVCLVRYQNT